MNLNELIFRMVSLVERLESAAPDMRMKNALREMEELRKIIREERITTADIFGVQEKLLFDNALRRMNRLYGSERFAKVRRQGKAGSTVADPDKAAKRIARRLEALRAPSEVSPEPAIHQPTKAEEEARKREIQQWIRKNGTSGLEAWLKESK